MASSRCLDVQDIERLSLLDIYCLCAKSPNPLESSDFPRPSTRGEEDKLRSLALQLFSSPFLMGEVGWG